MRALIAVMMALVGISGCVDNGEDDPWSGPVWATAPEGFFSGVPYRADHLDLDVLSQPVYEILAVEETWVTMSDGMRMHNALYRPDTDEPVPVWINFSPYWGDSAELKGDPFATHMIDNFVPRGYAVVLSAIRGTGHSEGCFEISSDRELQDLREVIDHFAGESWSTGSVGVGGKSYDSTPQNGMVAKFPTENLKTMFHVSGITDWYRYQFREGILARGDGGIFSTVYGVGQGIDEGVVPEDIEHLQRIIHDVACPELVRHIVEPGTTAVHGMKTPYWIERDWTRTIGSTDWDGSIFFYHGLQDWNVQPDHILPWLDVLPDQIRTKVWLHQDTDNGFNGGGHAYPMRTDWNLTMLRYMDSELKGIDTGFWDMPPVEIEGSDDLWREGFVWPLDVEAIDLPVEGGVVLEANETALRYGGTPSITATVTTMNPDGVFTAVLYDEDESGARSWRNEAVLRLLFSDGTFDLPSPAIPGFATPITAQFYPQDDILEPGHKWVVVFQADPQKSAPLPHHLTGVTVSDAVVHMGVAPAADGVKDIQPTGMPCITCP